MIDKFYHEIVQSSLVASLGLLQTSRKKCKFKIVPGWNNKVKDAHAAARRAYMKWLSNNRPRCGPSYIDIKETRKSFKYYLKHLKKNEEQLRADSITNSLKQDFTKKSFWSLINGSCMRKKKENKFSVCVGGASGPEAISSMWSNHYYSLLNCLTPSKEKLFVDSHTGPKLGNAGPPTKLSFGAP